MDRFNMFADLLSAGSLSLIFLVITRGEFARYMIAPCTLVWVHALGNVVQDYEIGPQWAQGHLHNAGAPAAITVFACLLAGMRHAARNGLLTPVMMANLAKDTLLLLPKLHITTTALLIGYEILDVVFHRSQLISEGYSGDVDTGDIIAYSIGAVIILVNHVLMSHRVRRTGGIPTRKSVC